MRRKGRETGWTGLLAGVASVAVVGYGNGFWGGRVEEKNCEIYLGCSLEPPLLICEMWAGKSCVKKMMIQLSSLLLLLLLFSNLRKFHSDLASPSSFLPPLSTHKKQKQNRHLARVGGRNKRDTFFSSPTHTATNKFRMKLHTTATRDSDATAFFPNTFFSCPVLPNQGQGKFKKPLTPHKRIPSGEEGGRE